MPLCFELGRRHEFRAYVGTIMHICDIHIRTRLHACIM
jgi:hypothetical protein